MPRVVEPTAARTGTGRAAGPFFPPGDGQSLPDFPGSFRVKAKTPMPGGRLRPRWKTSDGRIFEWDFQHGMVEGYDGRGRHLGEFDPNTGSARRASIPGRRVDP